MRVDAHRSGRGPGHGLRWTGRLAAFVAASVLAIGMAGCSLPQFGTGRDAEVASTEPATAEELAEIQGLLAERGYDPGPADGIMGPRTGAAIRRYQQEANLEPTGQATRGLLARLRNTATGPGRRPPKPAPAMADAPAAMAIGASSYVVGDTYVYTNGISQTVLRVGEDRVTWRDSRGDRFSTPLRAALPQLEWENGPWKGRNEMRLDSVTEWPPAKGATVSFDVHSEEWNVDAGPGSERMVTESRWTCRNDGNGKIEAPAGDFASTVITCERSPAPAGLWQRRVWHYAPAVARFIERTDSDGSGIEIESIRLVAALPGTDGWPPAARAGLKMAVDSALSNGSPGDETIWRSTAVSGEFAIRVTGERTERGKVCRTYVVSRVSARQRQLYPATACRAPGDREWRTPGFDGGVIGYRRNGGNTG